MTHCFDSEHAVKYGLEEAIFIYHFRYWILNNRANKRNFHEGRTWTYNSISAFIETFPYLSYKQVRRVLDSLKKQNVMVTGNFSDNKYDQTLWYAFSDESIFLPRQNDVPKRADGSDETGLCLTDNIPYNNTDNTITTVGNFGRTMEILQHEYPNVPEAVLYKQAQSILTEKPKSKPTESVGAKTHPLNVMMDAWLTAFPDYKHMADSQNDMPALRQIGEKLFGNKLTILEPDAIRREFCRFISSVKETWLVGKPLKTVKSQYQEVIAVMNTPKKPTVKANKTPFGF